jgi:hypothetical protein
MLQDFWHPVAMNNSTADHGSPSSSSGPETPIFAPDNVSELLHGWLLHAHKGRDRHDRAAQRCERQRLFLGIPATIASAIVGTATFAALQKSNSNSAIHLVVGGLAIVAAILVSLQSFLDLGARAERHRTAGVRYKQMIRDMEQLGIGTGELRVESAKIDELRQALDALEKEMPVVPLKIYNEVEAKYRNKALVRSVLAAKEQKLSIAGE